MAGTIYKLSHARHDPAHVLCPGLFRSLVKGERKRGKLDVTHEYGEESIRFWGPEPLGIEDLKVLQGLVAIAPTLGLNGKNGRGLILTSETDSDIGINLRNNLELKWDAIDKTAMVVKTTSGELAKEIGYKKSGKNNNKIRESVERLWAVSVIIKKNKNRMGFRLISTYVSKENNNEYDCQRRPEIAAKVPV
jgi:hypothetical protein